MRYWYSTRTNNMIMLIGIARVVQRHLTDAVQSCVAAADPPRRG